MKRFEVYLEQICGENDGPHKICVAKDFTWEVNKVKKTCKKIKINFEQVCDELWGSN